MGTGDATDAHTVQTDDLSHFERIPRIELKRIGLSNAKKGSFGVVVGGVEVVVVLFWLLKGLTCVCCGRGFA